MNQVVLPKTESLQVSIENATAFISVIIGPRQVGKTTAAMQITSELKLKVMNISADGEVLRFPSWLRLKWNEAIEQNVQLLVVDEIQKIENWSETVKELWDSRPKNFRLLLLGSSSLKIHKGLSESLAGRFRLFPFYHWNYFETNMLLEMSLEEFLRYGGYPGSYNLINRKNSNSTIDWLDYIKYSIIDPVIGIRYFIISSC